MSLSTKFFDVEVSGFSGWATVTSPKRSLLSLSDAVGEIYLLAIRHSHHKLNYDNMPTTCLFSEQIKSVNSKSAVNALAGFGLNALVEIYTEKQVGFCKANSPRKQMAAAARKKTDKRSLSSKLFRITIYACHSNPKPVKPSL